MTAAMSTKTEHEHGLAHDRPTQSLAHVTIRMLLVVWYVQFSLYMYSFEFEYSGARLTCAVRRAPAVCAALFNIARS